MENITRKAASTNGLLEDEYKMFETYRRQEVLN